MISDLRVFIIAGKRSEVQYRYHGDDDDHDKGKRETLLYENIRDDHGFARRKVLPPGMPGKR